MCVCVCVQAGITESYKAIVFLDISIVHACDIMIVCYYCTCIVQSCVCVCVCVHLCVCVCVKISMFTRTLEHLYAWKVSQGNLYKNSPLT